MARRRFIASATQSKLSIAKGSRGSNLPAAFLFGSYFTISVSVIGFSERFLAEPEGVAVGVIVMV